MNRMKLQRPETTKSVGADKLCVRCSGLNLSAETFLIEDNQPSGARGLWCDDAVVQRAISFSEHLTRSRRHPQRPALQPGMAYPYRSPRKPTSTPSTISRGRFDDRTAKYTAGRRRKNDQVKRTPMEPYFVVIDTENDSIVPLPFKESGGNLTLDPYATVSYAWGNDDDHSQHTTTSTKNIEGRHKSGGLAPVVPGLPKALHEAIELVHALGIRYIWIDALCVVQDSSHSWNLNAQAVHVRQCCLYPLPTFQNLNYPLALIT
ncbi:hypothetical protein B0T14DRAFT_519709 [Immersiella caudata]|uniref:Heterokaryon incompatibility domain-containing protein n=1 Tax=Immersiella caudata TaxID=314043 RepID=A0AA39WQG0_9PEZI|nr:hypothetical protein B0T14DRAFT_519709 [Immersiella caudata]